MKELKIIDIAKMFHDTYERLAPEFGYETREDTKEFDPESANGKLMIAVVDEVISILSEDKTLTNNIKI